VALSAISPRSRTQPDVIRTWFGTARGENGKTKVTFVWEPIPPSPGMHQADPPARVSVTAVAPDGSTYFRGRVPDVTLASSVPIPSGDGSATMASAGTSGSKGPSQVVFEVPPGHLQLRFQVENQLATVIDTDARELNVPDLMAPQVQLSTPEVLRARTVKEYRDLNTDPHAVPTANREFRRTDRLLIRFDAYGPAEAPQVAARLLNRTGQAMTDIPVSAQAAGATHQLDLPLASIAAADYIVEITAKGEGGEAKQLIAFRVVS
jgi:hypothetical protein